MKKPEKKTPVSASLKLRDALQQIVNGGSQAIVANRQEMERLAAKQSFQKDVLLLRQHEDGIPPNGFADPNLMKKWLAKVSQSEPDRYTHFRNKIRVLVAKYSKDKNFIDAITHYVLLGKIGHIQGNFSLSIDLTEGNKVSIDSSRRLTTGEGISAVKAVNALNDVIRPRKRTIKRGQQSRDLRYLQATTGRVREDFTGEDTPREEVKRKMRNIRTGRYRAKKNLGQGAT